MNVAHCPAVIVVFAMPGCSACDDFKPRLEREVQRWQQNGAPFVFAEPDREFAAHEIPVLLLDAQSTNAQIQGLADEFDVQGLPTTLLFRRNAQPDTFLGAIDDRQIYDLLLSATQA
jgi:thiol-disulfide isomerase/thioredoxin